MKKRILSLVLTLTMALALASPALAAEEKPVFLPESENDYLFTTMETEAEQSNPYAEFLEQFYVQYAQEHPEEYAAFDPHAWWQEDWGEYWDSEAEYIDHMVTMGYWDSADQFAWEMWKDYLGPRADEVWYNREIEAYRAAHPGELEALTTEQLLSWQGYTETLTPAARFAKDWDLADESQVAHYLLRNYVTGRNQTVETHETFLTYQADHPEEWAGFDADAYFAGEYGAWYDGGKTQYMLSYPLFTEEEFVEAMFVEYVDNYVWDWDGDIGYDDDWQFSYDGDPKPLRLVVNGKTMSDAAISAENGWSYIAPATANAILGTHYVEGGELLPLRATMESEGWDVGWNERENAIFLIDRAAAQTRIEESLAALDTLMGWALEHVDVESGQSYRTTETCEIKITTLNSLDGDKDYTLRLTLDMLQRDNALELTVKLNAADVLKLLGDDLVKLAVEEIPQLSLKDLPNLLKGLEFKAIADLDKGNFYWNLPVLAVFDDTVTADTWYGASLGMGVEEMLQAGLGMGSEELLGNLSGILGQFLYEGLLRDSARSWSSPESAWTDFEEMTATFNAIMGAGCIEEDNGKLIWKVDTQTVNSLMAQMSGEEIAPFKAYDISYVMGPDGAFTADMTLRPDFEALARAMYSDSYNYGSSVYGVISALTGRFLGLLDFQITAHSSGTMDKATGEMEYHQKNAFKVKVNTETERTKVNTAPALTPPEGAPVEMVMDMGTALLTSGLL